MTKRQKTDWEQVREQLTSQLSEEEENILSLLEAGRTQYEIGKELGTHRSNVWRCATKLRKAALV